MGENKYSIKWEYIISSCDQMDDWIALTEHYDPSKTDEKRVVQNIGFIENGRAFSYKGGLSKYANDTTYVERIEVTQNTVHIWISREVSRARNGYLFHNVQPQCRDDFLAYIRSREYLAEKLAVAPELKK